MAQTRTTLGFVLESTQTSWLAQTVTGETKSFRTEGEAKRFFARPTGTTGLASTVANGGRIEYQDDNPGGSGFRKIRVLFVTTQAPPIPTIDYPFATRLRIAWSWNAPGTLFEDPAGTVPATTFGHVRKWLDRRPGHPSFGINEVSDATSPTLDNTGVTMGLEGLARYLRTDVRMPSPYTVFLVSTRSPVASLNVCDADNELNVFLNMYPSAGGPRVFARQGGGDSLEVTDSDAGVQIRGAVFNATSSRAFVNSVLSGTPSTGVAADIRFSLGGSLDAYPSRITVQHVLVYYGALTPAEIATVQTFINTTLRAATPPVDPPGPATRKLYLGLDVHWEGDPLPSVSDPGYVSLEAVRTAYPWLVCTQFFSAQPYAVGLATNAAITAAYNAALHVGDEAGLHIHPQAATVAASGVAFRAKPSYAGANIDDPSGYSVFLWAYPSAELQSIVTYSLDKLESQGFVRPRAFLAGGFSMTNESRAAIRSAGMRVDASPVPPEMTTAYYSPTYPYLQSKIDEEYGAITTVSQPFTEGSLQRRPCNGGMIDYVTAVRDLQCYFDNIDQMAADGKDKLLVLATHISDVAAHGRLGVLLGYIQASCAALGITIVPVTASQAAALAP